MISRVCVELIGAITIVALRRLAADRGARDVTPYTSLVLIVSYDGSEFYLIGYIKYVVCGDGLGTQSSPFNFILKALQE